jgi:hypothetical protein
MAVDGMCDSKDSREFKESGVSLWVGVARQSLRLTLEALEGLDQLPITNSDANMRQFDN